MATPFEQVQPTENPGAKTSFPPDLGAQLLSTYEAAQILLGASKIGRH